MGKSMRILRGSLHAFFQCYHSFASTSALLVFPVSAAILLSQSLPLSSPVLRTILSRLVLLFEAAGFPAFTAFFSLLNLKLSQAIFSFICTLPFTLTSLLLAKAAIVRIILEHRYHGLSFLPFSAKLRIYWSLLLTHLFNSFVILSANAAVFSFLSVVFNLMGLLGISSSNAVLTLSAAGAIFYSLILANATVICNLATIVSVLENCSGYLAVIKACVLIRGQEATAMTLALPANLGMAGVEALFQYRVMKAYQLSGKLSFAAIGEAFSIGYMHSLLMVVDIIISYMFYTSCRSGYEYQKEVQPEHKGALQA